MRELLNKFEGARPKSPPKKQRVVSGLVPTRGPLSVEAESAREASKNRLSQRSAEAEHAGGPSRHVSRISATDSQEVFALKTRIIAKENEISDLSVQLKNMASRLDRVAENFLASAIEHEAAIDANKKSDQRVKALTVDAEKAVTGVAPKPKKPISSASSPTSLETILAAARGGAHSVSSGQKPKYAKILRDMK